MKRVIIAALSCALLALAGCSSSGGKPPPQTPDQQYVHALRKGTYGIQITSDSDADLTGFGHAVCASLENPNQMGFSLNPVDNLVHNGMDVQPAEAITQAAEHFLCPSANPSPSPAVP